MTIDVQNYFRQRIAYIDEALDQYLQYETPHPAVLFDAMRYSIFAGGKRVRPIMALAACEAFGSEARRALPVACALEMIHTYSLIHDDLPAMDNDDFRRGKATNHKVFGEAVAILAGDALLTKAFQLIATTYQYGVEPSVTLRLIEEVSKASGAMGMVGGQVADMEAEGKQIDVQEMEYIHAHKTGALFEVSVRAGAIVGGADEEQLRFITEFASKIGLAFQIQDDILDIVGDQEKTGKKVGGDILNEKATYPILYGLDASKDKVKQLTTEALLALEKAQCHSTEHLAAIAIYLSSREA